MSDENKGKQIDLNIGTARIFDGFFEDSFFAASSFLSIVFECDKKLTFDGSPDYYFTYGEIDWVPIESSEINSNNGTWHYDITAYPRTMCMVISKPCKNTQELARSLRLSLSDNSSNLPLPCPVINQVAGNFIQDSRLFSFEKAKVEDKLNSALFIYVRATDIISVSWKTLVSQKANNLEFEPLMDGSNLIMNQDIRLENKFTCAHGPQIWKQKDYIGKIMGTNYTIKTTQPVNFLSSYTMKFKEHPEQDSSKSYLCTYIKRKLTDANSYIETFTNFDFKE